MTSPTALAVAEPDRHLLSFAVAPTPSLAEWESWSDSVDLDDHSRPSFQLLPATYERLRRLGADHRWMPRLKGIYRRSWTNDQLVTTRSAEVRRVLHDAGIPTLEPVDAQIRSSMDTPEMLPLARQLLTIPWSDVGAAADALRTSGFDLQPTTDRQARLPTRLVSTRWSIRRDDVEHAAVTDTYFPSRRTVGLTGGVWDRAEGDAPQFTAGLGDLLAAALLLELHDPPSLRWALALAGLGDVLGTEIVVPDVGLTDTHRSLLAARVDLWSQVHGAELAVRYTAAPATRFSRSAGGMLERWGGAGRLPGRVGRRELL